MSATAKPSRDVAAEITNLIIKKLEEGVPPWSRPWRVQGSGGRPLRHCGTPYTGINTFYLWAIGDAQGYRSRYWMTYRQAEALGGHVRRGEVGSLSVYYSSFKKTEANPVTGAEKERSIRFLRHYIVFNADQIDGLPESYYRKPESARDLGTEPDAELEAFFAATGAIIDTSDEPRAYYNPVADRIHMPPVGTFESAGAYYATLAHEATHWTGHGSRLDRIKKFADRKAYAFEELVAELGNVILCTHLGLTPDFEQSAAYVESWLKALKEDKRAIFRAAAEGQKAADLLRALAGPAESEAAA